MLHRTRNLVEDWRKGDGDKLARLEMESAIAWPGGGGWQTTAEEEERHLRESNLVGAFVTEERDRIIGICTLWAKPGQKEHAYIPYLNCHPAYHGKKHGKSVLRASVERAYQEGFRKVDLNTWPANLKAVPLYKKMGFMWRPDSSVRMENFTPAARRHSLGRAFFSRHDWYETQVRELKPEEDLVKRGRVKVYEYLWQGKGGEFLRMVFDRQSWDVIEIENNELLASCRLPDEKLVAGIPHTARWCVMNKRPDPVQVFLTVSGDPGISAEKREVLEVADSVETVGTFVIDPDLPEKKEDPRASILRTDLVIDGMGMVLAAGIGVRQAVDVSADAPRSILSPGASREVILTLRSNLEKKCKAVISVKPAGGVMVQKGTYGMTMDAKGAAEVSIPLLAKAEGPVVIEVETSAVMGTKRIPVKTKRIDLLAVKGAGVSGCLGEDHALVCSGGLVMSVGLRGGRANVFQRLRAGLPHRLDIHRPQIGPPFTDDEFFEEKAEATLHHKGGAMVLRLRTRSILRPGLMLERRIVLGPGPIIEVVDTGMNGTGCTLDLNLKWGCFLSIWPRAELVVPRDRGVYRDICDSGGRSLRDLKLPTGGDKWAEGWFCLQDDQGCSAGILWDQAERVRAGSWGEIERKIGRIEPGESKTMEPVYAFVGEGGWQTVRGWWQTLIGEGVPEHEAGQSPTRRPIETGIEPNPLIVKEEKTKASLFLRNVGDHKLKGRLEVKTPTSLRSTPNSVVVPALCQERPLKRRIEFKRSKRIRAGLREVDVRFVTEEAIYREVGRVVVLAPKAPPVEVYPEEDSSVLAIDNGILTVKVAPGFLGSVISLKRDGREFLNSAYPRPSTYGWMNPWHGGISPMYGRLWGNLHKEKFHCRIVRRRGHQGLIWHGIRVTSTIKNEDARGHSIAIEYLLAQGVDVLAILPTCREVLGIHSRGDLGFMVFPAFAKAAGRASFWSPTSESVTALSPPHWSGAGNWQWGGILGKNGQVLFLSARGREAHAGGESTGATGCMLEASIRGRMAARGRIEGLFFLLPAFDRAVAETHAVWSEFLKLP